MEFDYINYPYSSRRQTVFAQNGMVCSSQPLVSQLGVEILRKGGNAVDAAVGAAAALTVLEPTSNGIGSDSFALVWYQNQLYGLNSSGPAPANISAEKIKEKGYDSMPRYGALPVTVPGAPASWSKLSARFGELSLAEVLKPAIKYAREGYPVAPTTARCWEIAYDKYRKVLNGEQFKPWFDIFAPRGRAPQPGEIWKSPHQAETLSAIAETGADSFYRGKTAEKISDFIQQQRGFLTYEDLADFNPEWVTPLKINYRGYDVWELPPNGQGLVALIALNILKGFDFEVNNHVDSCHKQLEAIKLAFADGKKHITDREMMSIRPQKFLSDEYGAQRRNLITGTAGSPEPGQPSRGGTVYLAAADRYGNMVSFIQSNYMGFGSGLVVPETGIALQNRGHNFTLDPKHDNCIKPGARPYHTIIPGFLTKNDRAVGPFGVMGGFMQPQGHLQVIMNTIDFQLNPQAALDAPRWQWLEDRKVKVEPDFPTSTAQQLARRGHDIEIALDSLSFGRGQIIWKDQDSGVYAGGTEPRTDGCIAGF